MRVIIAEDNPIEMNFFKEILSNYEDISIVGEVNNGSEASRIISKLKPDVAFLDISMPGINGIELAEKLNGDIFVVFITAHNDFAIRAFEIGSLDYILKPVEPERLNLTLERIRKLYPFRVGSKKISVNIKGSIIPIDIERIIFIEKLPIIKKVTIQLDNQNYLVSGTLEDFEKRLKNHGFVRSHKSFIINVKKVEKMIPWGDKSYLAKMHGTKKEVLISRHYAPTIKASF
jgi:DNA-binding LytR/AlgR family response regulator